MGARIIEAMTWLDFVTQFRGEFTLVVEVQQLAREFLNMRQTMAEITTKFRERPLLIP